MALFFCGILMSHYAIHNVSQQTQTTTKHAFASIAMVAETFVVCADPCQGLCNIVWLQFAYLGITAVISFNPIFHLRWSLSLIFCTLVRRQLIRPTLNLIAQILCLVSRAFNIFPFAVISNMGTAPARSTVRCSSQHRTHQSHLRKNDVSHVVCWTSWSYRLCALLKHANDTPSNGVYQLCQALFIEHTLQIVTSTMTIVIITTLVFGGLTEPLVSRLGLKAGNIDNPEALAYQAVYGEASRQSATRDRGCSAAWSRFDQKYCYCCAQCLF